MLSGINLYTHPPLFSLYSLHIYIEHSFPYSTTSTAKCIIILSSVPLRTILPFYNTFLPFTLTSKQHNEILPKVVHRCLPLRNGYFPMQNLLLMLLLLWYSHILTDTLLHTLTHSRLYPAPFSAGPGLTHPVRISCIIVVFPLLFFLGNTLYGIWKSIFSVLPPISH